MKTHLTILQLLIRLQLPTFCFSRHTSNSIISTKLFPSLLQKQYCYVECWMCCKAEKTYFLFNYKSCLKNHCIFTTPTSISWVSYIQILLDLWSQCLTSFPSPICHENYFNSLRSLFKFHLLNEAIPRRQWIGHRGRCNENGKGNTDHITLV